ncbi:hypothetical protein [Streptosporangium carneum]|uniref:Uncharacterized protein n=1 Tax=Streptosporangium carneum TaxID=47481 RepID=A0A9W6MDJ3_9ACTN|nr:hypothetical protein [Streptosporangium carneum]GLK10569.1 hypothetical protein GCM10017600_39750 [Streptosporangium carneum]
MSTFSHHHHDPVEQAVVQALADVHARGDGLFSQALVIVNDDVTFDDVNGYRTAVNSAGSGGEAYYSLTAREGHGHPRPDHVSEDEARLSQRDSEVATLQDAYDWLDGQGVTLNVSGVRVVLVGNIGPCDGCKARLNYFLGDVVELFGSKVPVVVDSVYDTSQAHRQLPRQGITTVYGYPDATPYTHTASTGTRTRYWLHRNSFTP